MKLSRKWINEEFADLSHISDRKFVETMEMLGHKVTSWRTKDTTRADGGSADNDHDTIVDFKINCNRPDCYSLLGLAREAAAGFHVPMKHRDPIVKGNDEEFIYDLLDVDVPAEGLCNRYSARMVKNVKVAPSPKWLCDRLIDIGIAPVNNIIDITNYVRIEYGQPVFAYDYRNVSSGRMVVREAEEGEMFTDIDGKQYQLQSGMLVVTDDTGMISIAGITGAIGSGITDNTRTVVFEAANFNSDAISKTSLELGIKNENSIQFENSPDSMLTVPALQRTCELIELLQCGDVVDGMIDVLNYVPAPRTVEFNVDQINPILHAKLTKEDMVAYLKRLEIVLDGDAILLPSFRPDLSSITDIAMEIERIHKLIVKEGNNQ